MTHDEQASLKAASDDYFKGGAEPYHLPEPSLRQTVCAWLFFFTIGAFVVLCVGAVTGHALIKP